MENFQASAVRQGKIGEDIAAIRIQDAGFTILETRASLPGVEVDIIAENIHGIAFYFSIKASWRGERQGLKRTDTLKKAIAEAFLISLNGLSPFVIITSHKPSRGRGMEMLKMVPRTYIYDVIELHNDGRRLNWLARATESDLEKDLR